VGTFDLKDAGVMLRGVEKGVWDAAFKGLVAAAHKTVEHIVGDIIPSFGDRMPVDRGAYRAGWRVQPMRGEGKVLVQNSAPHAVFIEDGVRAGSVKIGRKLIEALTEWVKRKGIGGRTVTSSNGRARHVKATNSEATSIAWAIAKSMQKKGIFGGTGLRIMEKAEKRVPGFIRESVSAELRKLK
jgi:hypothetical protein